MIEANEESYLKFQEFLNQRLKNQNFKIKKLEELIENNKEEIFKIFDPMLTGDND